MSTQSGNSPRVGIPYRTRKEELTGKRDRYDLYREAVRQAGGEPIEISLGIPEAELEQVASSLDAVLLPGSPADVSPAIYGAPRHAKCADADTDRERTDFILLRHAFAECKPVLAVCYGIQSLNAFLGGSLIQDIGTEVRTPIHHEWHREKGDPEPFHQVEIETGSRLAGLAGATSGRVNSSHHQSIQRVGRDLRVVARAPDGVIEAVEWTRDSTWVTGVQWHPERMAGADALARALFRELVGAGRKARSKDLTAPAR